MDPEAGVGSMGAKRSRVAMHPAGAIAILSALMVLASCQPDSVADIIGTISLAPGLSSRVSGAHLIVRASPQTLAAEFLEMEALRRAVRASDFPFAFHLRGRGGPVGNLLWIVEAWISADAASEHPSGSIVQGFEQVLFDCDMESERCRDARVQIVFDVP